MFKIIGFFLLVGAIALGLSWLVDNPGNISVVWHGYRIETSVIIALALMAAGTLVLSLAWALLRFTLGLPAAISFSARARRRAKGLASVSRGLIAVGTGDPVSARRHAAEAGRLLGREPLSLLLRAQAAQMTGNRSEAEVAFNLMLDTPETRVLGLRGLFVEARRKGDEAAARAYAQKACELAPKVAWASEAVLEFQSTDQDWRAALVTLERQIKQKTLNRDVAKRLRAVLLTADALFRQEDEPDEALKQAREAAKLAPDLVPASVLAGRMLSQKGRTRHAAKVLEAAWRHGPHPDIAAAYIDLRTGDSAHDRFERAKKLAATLPDHFETRLMLASAALEIKDYTEARHIIAPLLIGYPTVRTCQLMADIAEAEHGVTGEWREWIGRAARAPRDATWIADGFASETWAPVSPVTGRLDAFEWLAPTAQIADAHAIENDANSDLQKQVLLGAAETSASLPQEDNAGVENFKAQEPITWPSEDAHPVVFAMDHAPDDPGVAGEDTQGNRSKYEQLAGQTP